MDQGFNMDGMDEAGVNKLLDAAWPGARQAQEKTFNAALQAQKSKTTTTSSPKPRVLLISLNNQPFFDDMFANLINAISDRAQMQRAKKAAPAIRALAEDPRPAAVLVTDEGLTLAKNAAVWDSVLAYVCGGGTAVVMGTFSSFVKPNQIKPFFAKANLEWASGDYHRTTLHLNLEAVVPGVGMEPALTLAKSYSQKALNLKNVARDAAWYLPNNESVTESAVFPPTRIESMEQTPVAFASVGDGKLGYLGDVNAEAASDKAILAMCGL